MTNTARKIERRPEHIRQRDTLHAWELTPQSLREILLFQKDRLSTDIMQVVPLTRAVRSVLLDHVHFLGREARTILLLRMATAHVQDEALLVALCERSGRRVRTEALQRARKAQNRAAAWVIEESLGDHAPAEEKPGFLTNLWERFCGLAY